MGHAMPSGVTRFGVGLGFLDRNEAHTGFTSMAWIIGSQLKIAFVSRILKVKKKQRNGEYCNTFSYAACSLKHGHTTKCVFVILESTKP